MLDALLPSEGFGLGLGGTERDPLLVAGLP
jgi:hypothetical protein